MNYNVTVTCIGFNPNANSKVEVVTANTLEAATEYAEYKFGKARILSVEAQSSDVMLVLTAQEFALLNSALSAYKDTLEAQEIAEEKDAVGWDNDWQATAKLIARFTVKLRRMREGE